MKKNMKLKTKIAQQMKDIFLERDWSVATSYKTELTDLPWKKATTKLGSMNSIAVLAFHIDYYIAGILNVF
jgi:hypothetical protein